MVTLFEEPKFYLLYCIGHWSLFIILKYFSKVSVIAKILFLEV